MRSRIDTERPCVVRRPEGSSDDARRPRVPRRAEGSGRAQGDDAPIAAAEIHAGAVGKQAVAEEEVERLNEIMQRLGLQPLPSQEWVPLQAA